MKKRIIITLVIGIAVFFDTALDLLLSGLHFVVESLELGFEHLLMHVWHLEKRQAQVITAWTLLFVVCYLGYLLYLRLAALYRRAIAAFPAWRRQRIDQLNLWWLNLPWLHKAAGSVVLLTAVVLYFMFFL